MLNRLQNNSLIAVVVGLLLWTPFAGFGQIVSKDEANAAKLTPELFNLQRKEAEQKSPQTSKNLRQAAAPNDVPWTKIDRTRVRDGLVAIEGISNGSDGQALLNDLQALGLRNGKYHKRIVFGYFPIDKLGLLRNVATLHVARSSYGPLRNAGKVTSQGDKAMRSDIARQTYNVTGVGSKVGILSDSYNALGGAAAGVASDELPPGVQILKDFSLADDSSFSDEGRGMAEIVHDVAPGANLAFHTAYDGYVDFALGILSLGEVGCNIIVDDVSYSNEPFFQDGIIAQAVNYVSKEQNVSYFSSAGNSARQSYTSPFRNSGKLPPGLPSLPLKGNAHDFGNGNILQKITIPPGGSFQCFFQWSDPFYSEGTLDVPQGVWDNGILGAKTDMDILVYYRGVLIPQLSSRNPNIGYDPYEDLFVTNSSRTPLELEIALVKVDGPDPALIKWIDWSGSASVQFATQSSTVYGHANAEGAIAVGAALYLQTPAYNSTRYPNALVEFYSSVGGTPILFTNYGQPFPTIIRKKPEITAPDGGNTSFFIPGFDLERDGFPNFTGTSAAAPHAAAVAALLQERSKNKMSPDDVKKRLEVTALDMDDPSTTGFDFGFDFQTGYGLVQADKALMFGQPLVILEPIYDCQTHKITLLTNGGDGTPITFTVPGVIRTPPSSTTATAIFFVGGQLTYTIYTPESTTGIVEAGIIADPKPIVITAEQNGVKVTYTFNLVEYCARPRVFAVIEPLYDCATGKITFRTEGGNGSPITYTAPGVQRSSLTDPNGTVEAGLRNDPKSLTITAEQSGVTSSYVFDFAAYCRNQNRARVAASEPASGLQVSVMGNPIANDWVEVEVRGVQGQPLKLQVNNTVGALTSSRSVEMAEGVERHKLALGRAPGLYLLQVSTPSETKTIKLIRQ